MQYNIHPLFVHFPIAFLLLYSVIRILPLERWLSNINWKSTRLVLLVCGVAGAIFSNLTGEIAEHIVRPNHDIVETHAFFALTSGWIYGILLLGELVFVLKSRIFSLVSNVWVKKILDLIDRVLNNKYVVILLSLAGVLAISITGLLGGVMVYGVSADPLAPFVLRILGLL